MRRCACILNALLVGLITQASIGCRPNHPSHADAERNAENKTVRHAPGTIVSVEERAHDEQSEDLLPGPRICFKIDSFDEVPGPQRSVYESAERAREVAQGPRCRNTALDPSAVHFKAGDSVEVYFTLGNAGQISVIRISTHGVDL